MSDDLVQTIEANSVKLCGVCDQNRARVLRAGGTYDLCDACEHNRKLVAKLKSVVQSHTEHGREQRTEIAELERQLVLQRLATATWRGRFEGLTVGKVQTGDLAEPDPFAQLSGCNYDPRGWP